MADVTSQKNYVVRTVQTLFNLDSAPYELESSQAL